MGGQKALPNDPHPKANERFEQLLGLMAPQAVEIPEEEPEELGPERDEDCDDTQTPTDTSEDAS
jgi:hypothetical protein